MLIINLVLHNLFRIIIVLESSALLLPVYGVEQLVVAIGCLYLSRLICLESFDHS